MLAPKVPAGRRLRLAGRRRAWTQSLSLLIVTLVCIWGPWIANARAQQPTFPTCDTSLYLAQQIPTQLTEFNTATNPFIFTDIGGVTAGVAYNAIGFNPGDSYIYGILNNSRRLVRIGGDGSTVDLGAIAQLSGTSFNAGEIGPTGVYYVKPAGETSDLYMVNLATRTATVRPLNRSINVADLAWFNNRLYAVGNLNGRFYEIDPATGNTVNVGPTGVANPFGALFGATSGVYGVNNAGGFYKFDVTTGAATLIAGAPGSDQNDGAKCVNTPIDYPVDLEVTKTDNATTFVPGRTVVYTIVVRNLGPFGTQGALVDDPLPTGISTGSWTCGNATGDGVCTVASGTGGISSVPVNLPAGASVTFTFTIAVPANATGPLVNTVTVTTPIGSPDTNPANNTATDTNSLLGEADLAVSKSSTPRPYVPGAPFTYTVIASNNGPSDIVGATVDDTLPGALAAFTWTCTASTRASCGVANGTGPLANVPVNLAAGSSVTFIVTGTLAPGTSGALINTATIAPPPGAVDPTPGNNSSTDVNPVGAQADLRISKASTPNPYVPGTPLTYTLVVTNAGPSDAVGARVQDLLPAALAAFTWTCTAVGGAACGTASGAGNVDLLVDLPVGSSVTVTSTGTVPSSFTGTIVNTATVTPPPTVSDPVPGNNSSTSTNANAPSADLSIAKTQSPNPYAAGLPLTFTVVVSNGGPSDAIHARVQDLVPSEITGTTWTCAAAAGAVCETTSGANVVDAFVTLPSATSVVFTITGTVQPGVSGPLTNTATVTPPTDVADPNPGNNGASITSLGVEADLSVVKTATPNPYVPGEALTSTIVVSNAGPSPVENARVQDTFPPAMSSFTWTCVAGPGAACGTPSGLSVIDALVSLGAGSSVTFTATGVVPPDAAGPQSNTVTVTPPPGVTDPNPPNNTSTTTPVDAPHADLTVTKTAAPRPYVAGSPLFYTVIVGNAGPSAVSGAHVRDTVPLVLENVTWTCAAVNALCPTADGIGNIDLLVDLVPGATLTFAMTGLVPVGTNGTIVNTALVVPPPTVIDPNPDNNSAVVFDAVSPSVGGPADLQITQVFPTVAAPAGQLVFTLVSTNLGPNPAVDPYITGMIPPGTTFVSVTPSAGGTCTQPGNPPPPNPVTGYPTQNTAVAPLRCTWPGVMEVGDSRTMQFVVQVAPTIPPGQILWSCFWTWSESEDPYHPNNVVDAYLFVHDGSLRAGDLGIQGASLSNGIIGPQLGIQVGEVAPIRFWVTNHGPARARGQYALILDRAETIDVVNLSVPQGWVAPTGAASAVWDTGPIEPGQVVALDILVRIKTVGALALFAQRVTGQPADPNASNERATIVLDGLGPNAGGRWVAVGNVDATGVGEIITGAGLGEIPQVRILSGLGSDTGMRFLAYEQTFAGGVGVASCDVDLDGMAEVITAPGAGRASTIRVLRLVGSAFVELTAFDAFETGFLGGASIACGDVDGDGFAEVIVGAGAGRAPEVRVYSVGPSTATLRASFLAFEDSFRGGVRVTAGRYPGRVGWLAPFDIAVTPGPGRPAEIRLWQGDGTPVAQALISLATSGVSPTLGDVNGDGSLDLVVTADDGRPELIRVFDVDTGTLIGEVPAGLPGFPVGIRVAVGVVDGGPGLPELIVVDGVGGHPRVRVVFWSPSGPIQRLELSSIEVP